jgi:hypothetical protein
MPHEALPDPDWTKASDKSAADWQAEAGIGDMGEEEKAETIALMIAQAKGMGAEPAAGSSGPQAQGNGNGVKPPPNGNGNRTAPAYKRWKPK